MLGQPKTARGGRGRGRGREESERKKRGRREVSLSDIDKVVIAFTRLVQNEGLVIQRMKRRG
jgi:hypothetical protein